MKIFQNIYIAIVVLIISIVVFAFTIFQVGLTKVSNNHTLKEIIIEPGNIDSITTTLYNNHLIKNKLIFKIYVQITGNKNLKAATYQLSEDMGVKKIVKILSEGKGTNSNQIQITFKEGLNIRQIAKIVEQNTSNKQEDFYNQLKDTKYLQQLIERYWFLEPTILNEEIYYSLEGYLFPNTYYFSSKDVAISTIIEVMLDETKKQLEPYQSQITTQKKNVHEILTLASMVELEGASLEDRKKIIGVFNNRLKAGMNLGSDVTTYYGVKVDIGDRDLYSEEVTACNHYNTRCPSFVEIPVSPVCNPSMDSIVAVLEPDQNDYYYFVSDKNKKVYFSKNITEQTKTINRLKKENLWYEHE